MKIPRILVLFLIIISLPAEGQDFSRVGTTGYAFLELPVSARTAGIGEASVALPDANAEAVFINPALLGFMSHKHVAQVSFANWLAETKHEAISYAIDLEDVGVFGVGLVRLDMGTMQGTVNADPTRPGSYILTSPYSADAIAVSLTYARRLTDRFSFGATVKYVREGLTNVEDITKGLADYTSTNVVFDAGVLYYTGLGSLRIAASIRDFGVDSKYIGDSFKMPTTMRLGAAMEIVGDSEAPQRLTTTVEALHPSNHAERVNLGVEYWFQNLVALRVGYKYNYDEERLAAGIGLRWAGLGAPLEFDASYTGYGRLGSVVRLTLQAAL
jgi:hypothetical protein